MENKDWLNEYMSLKQVTPGNPFTVPSGYFDDLAQRIISVKNLEELKGEGTQGFTLPENYFDELAGNIQSRINIENTLTTVDTGFTVPEGYFDDLTQQITSRIAVERALAGTEEQFTVPEGYFDNLTQQITSRIAVEEALAGLEEQFAVPENYFEQLNNKILAKTVNEGAVEPVNLQPVQRRGIVRRMYASVAFKYAAAACVVLMVGGGVLINNLSTPAVVNHKDSLLHKELSGISADDIKSYLQLNSDANDTQREVTADDVPVDANSLNNALQDYNDNVQ